SARAIAHHGPMSSDLVAPVEADAARAPFDEAAATDADAGPLARNRDFRTFVIAEGISSVGDAVSFTALPLLVLALTGSGFAMAGLLATAIGPGQTLGIDAASFVVASIGIALIRRPLHAPGDRPESHLVVDIREGIEFIVRHPVLRSSILFWSATSVVSAGLVTALTVRITRDLALPASALGLFLATFGLGTVVVALWASRMRTVRAWSQILGGNLARGIALVVV